STAGQFSQPASAVARSSTSSGPPCAIPSARSRRAACQKRLASISASALSDGAILRSGPRGPAPVLTPATRTVSTNVTAKRLLIATLYTARGGASNQERTGAKKKEATRVGWPPPSRTLEATT